MTPKTTPSVKLIKNQLGTVFKSDAPFVVVPINTVGAMGVGVARECRDRYPDAYYHYKRHARKRRLNARTILLYTPEDNPRQTLVMVPTKDHWKNPSTVEQITWCIESLVRLSRDRQWPSMAMVPLGCGYGGLDYEQDVRPIVERYINDTDTEIEIWIKS